MTGLPLTVLVGVGAGYVFLRLLLHFTQDPREPPAVETAIPFISPIVGMLTKKVDFYTGLRYAGMLTATRKWADGRER